MSLSERGIMMVSGHDWFFRVEFLSGKLKDGTLATVLDDGAACEDHVIVVDTNQAKPEQIPTIIQHELLHAVARMTRRRK